MSTPWDFADAQMDFGNPAYRLDGTLIVPQVYRFSRLEISCPKASADGKYYGRYPNGNNPAATGLVAHGSDSLSAAGALATAIRLACSASDVFSGSGALTTSSGSAAGKVKLTNGIYMLSNGTDSTGTSNNLEFEVVNSSPKLVGWMGSYTHANTEPTQNSYNFANTIVADILALNSTANGATKPMKLCAAVKTRAFLGNGNYVGPIGTTTQKPYNTYNGAGYSIPNWIVNCGGSLASNDGKYTTTTAPKSPNTSQYFWWAGQFDGTDYQYMESGAWFHPVYAQILLNWYQALSQTICPAFSIGGTSFVAQTLDKHPCFEAILPWDEESIGLGGGGGFLSSPPTDANVKVNGAAFKSVLNSSVAGNTPVEMYAYREQTLIGAKQTGGFVTTSVANSFGFLVSSGSLFATIAQLRTHLNNCYLGLVEATGQDLYGDTYCLSYPTPVPWSYAQPSGSTRHGDLIFVGCVWPDEASESPGVYVPPSNGVPASAKQPDGSTVTGFVYSGKMGKTGFVGQGDYSEKYALSSTGSNILTEYTTPVVEAIWNSAQFDGCQRVLFAHSDNRFTNVWDSYIYTSDGTVILSHTAKAIQDYTLNALQSGYPTIYP